MVYINNNKIKGFGGIKRAYLNNALIFQSFKKDEEVISPYDITSTFNVTSTTSPTKLCNISSLFNSMYVDGVKIDVTSDYTFSTTGEHKVQYILKDNTTIGYNAFFECTSLTSIEIPNSVTSIGNSVFYSCTSLTSVTIPSSVTSIVDYAFWNCSSLTSIELPSSLTSISMGIFRSCSSLTSVTIPNSVTSIGYESFRGCSSLTSVEIPNSVTSIYSFAFYNCKSLTSIEIPSSVTSISDYAFKNCSSLTEITCNSTSAPTIGTDVFNGVPSSGTLIYPCESDYSTWLTQLAWEDTCNTTPYDITSTFNVTSTTSPTKLCDSAYTSAFTEMYVDGVQIDVASGYTFNTTGKHTVGYTLSDKTTIGKYLFDGCSGLTSVKIIDSVTSIGQSAFYGCSGLTSIKIPDNVTIIEQSAFNGCRMLESITIPSSLITIGDAAFQQCSSLTSITIPSSVTSIGSSIFVNCYFESDKFVNNSSVSGYPWSATICDVIQEDGLCISGTTAIKCRPKATNVVVPESVTSIKNEAFYNCKRLISVDIGNGVTTIGTGVFRDCTSLKNVIFGSGVTSIGSNFGFMSKGIFYGCTSLTEITCLAPTAPTLLKTSIQGIENNGGTLYVPNGSDYSTWKAILTSWNVQYLT